jgi:F-type H+-transporting ATPase subunit b
MDPTLLKSLGELLLNAIPTIVLFLLLFWGYTALVYRPLLKVLAQRHALTEGAVAKAQSDIAAADAKTQEYELALREARASMFKELEQRRQKLMEARSAAIAAARQEAETRTQAAKAEIDKQAAAARTQLEAQAEALSNQVIAHVLHASAGSAR